MDRSQVKDRSTAIDMAARRVELSGFWFSRVFGHYECNAMTVSDKETGEEFSMYFDISRPWAWLSGALED